MGLLSSLAGIAAPIAGTILGGPVGGAIGGAVGGLLSGSGQPKNLTSTSSAQLDPRADAVIWGKPGQGGLIDTYQGLLNQPRSQASEMYGNVNADYLGRYGGQDLNAVRNAAMQAMQGNSAPMSQAAQSDRVGAGLNAYAVGNQIQAPNQNNIDLTGSYQNLLGGGDMTALNTAMNSAVNATNAGFKTNQDNVTNALMRNVLPSIRSNAVLAGQYGSSRQGVAEGNAISDYTNQLTNANTSLAATNSANTTAQAANAYQQGQDRALAATQSLGAQQYGVASQNANTKNAAEFMNVGNTYDLGKFNAGLEANNNQFNAGLNQQTNLANQSSQLQTNGQNNGSLLSGAGLLSGLTGQVSNNVNASDNYGLDRAQQVNSLLAPYLGTGQTQTSSQPLYQNQAGNALGGLLAGGQLAGMFGGGKSSTGASMGSIFDLFGSNSTFGKY